MLDRNFVKLLCNPSINWEVMGDFFEVQLDMDLNNIFYNIQTRPQALFSRIH